MIQQTMQPEEEVWLPAPGYEGFYEVSNFGRAKRLACKDVRGGKLPERMLKVHVQRYNAAGYLRSFVCFGVGRGDRKSDTLSIGRLVLLAFKGPPPSPEENNTRHLDDDITNNHISNLEWGTHEQNVHDAIKNGRRITYGEQVKLSKLTEADVVYIRSVYKPWSRQFGAAPLARKFGVCDSVIFDAAYRKSWKHVE